MLSSHKRLEIDSSRLFRWSFLVIFLLLEWFTWQRIGRRLMFMPVRRVPIVRIAIWASWRAAFSATVLAGAVTLAASLFVSLIWQRLLDLWRRPAFDPSAWLFHLNAGEVPVASLPARWKSGGLWRPGALVLTGRRIWFMPAGWDVEPWSMARQDCARVEALPPALARFLPVRHWPELLRFTSRTGDHASFAVADPDAVLAWFSPSGRPDAFSSGHRVVPQGVFDA